MAAYYFPNYHTGDRRNIQNKGVGWSEWELVKTARPRFPGHDQPKVPLWGHTDEKDPKVMARKIRAASGHGIDCFIFDWYMYEDGPFLNRCLDEGFLKAKNADRLAFALMWANHDWQRESIPYTNAAPNTKCCIPAKFQPGGFRRNRRPCSSSDYFTQPVLLGRSTAKPYFSFYDLTRACWTGFGSGRSYRAGRPWFR